MVPRWINGWWICMISIFHGNRYTKPYPKTFFFFRILHLVVQLKQTKIGWKRSFVKVVAACDKLLHGSQCEARMFSLDKSAGKYAILPYYIKQAVCIRHLLLLGQFLLFLLLLYICTPLWLSAGEAWYNNHRPTMGAWALICIGTRICHGDRESAAHKLRLWISDWKVVSEILVSPKQPWYFEHCCWQEWHPIWSVVGNLSQFSTCAVQVAFLLTVAVESGSELACVVADHSAELSVLCSME